MRKVVFALLALLSIVATPVYAQIGADLNISPKRLSLSEARRSATVYIFNQGDAPATYTIDLVDRIMAPNGEISPAEPSTAAASARDLIQFTPHRVTLQPKESQAIRLRVQSPSAPGEYRSHLTVTALPPEDTGLTAARAAVASGPEDLAVQIVTLFSISIPVIVREGPVQTLVTIENPSLRPAPQASGLPSVTLQLARSGAGSVYGDIEAYVEQGKERRRIGFVRGVAVYPEIKRRAFIMPLSAPVRPGERLRIVYRDDDQQPGSELATAVLVAP